MSTDPKTSGFVLPTRRVDMRRHLREVHHYEYERHRLPPTSAAEFHRYGSYTDVSICTSRPAAKKRIQRWCREYRDKQVPVQVGAYTLEEDPGTWTADEEESDWEPECWERRELEPRSYQPPTPPTSDEEGSATANAIASPTVIAQPSAIAPAIAFAPAIEEDFVLASSDTSVSHESLVVNERTVNVAPPTETTRSWRCNIL